LRSTRLGTGADRRWARPSRCGDDGAVTSCSAQGESGCTVSARGVARAGDTGETRKAADGEEGSQCAARRIANRPTQTPDARTTTKTDQRPEQQRRTYGDAGPGASFSVTTISTRIHVSHRLLATGLPLAARFTSASRPSISTVIASCSVSSRSVWVRSTGESGAVASHARPPYSREESDAEQYREFACVDGIGLRAEIPLHGRSPVWTWTLWLVGHYRATGIRLVVLAGDTLAIRAGLRLTARLPLAVVANVDEVSWRTIPQRTPGYINAAGPGHPNVVLTLRQPTTVTGSFGLRRTVTRIGLRLDDPSGFGAAVRQGAGTETEPR